jgi:hypothetical protein
MTTGGEKANCLFSSKRENKQFHLERDSQERSLSLLRPPGGTEIRRELILSRSNNCQGGKGRNVSTVEEFRGYKEGWSLARQLEKGGNRSSKK